MSWCDIHDQYREAESVFDPELLLVLAKGGDGAALGRLLERYRNYVGLLVRLQVGRRLRTKVDIEDLLQEIWLEIHRKIGLFRGTSEREFLSWARRLIGSILANQVRHYIGTKSRDLPPGASAGRRAGPIIASAQRKPDSDAQFTQPASRSQRAGSTPG